MKSQKIPVGSRGVDSYPFSLAGTLDHAKKLAADGQQFLVGYLGIINAARVKHVLDAGMAFMPVTLAGEYNDGPNDEIAQLNALAIPNCTVWLDLEGMAAFRSDPMLLKQKINVWAKAIIDAGYEAGLYVGVPQPLTSAELYGLMVTRYWRGQGSIRDRHNDLAEPQCGWCMYQCYPQHMRAGTLVDCDIVQQDYRGRVPSWVAP